MSDPLWDESKIKERLDRDAMTLIRLVDANAAMLELQRDYETDRAASAQTIAKLETDVEVCTEYITSLERQREELRSQLARALRPAADVYVTVDMTQTRVNQLEQCLAIVTNEFLYAKSAEAVERMKPYMHRLYSQISFHLSGGFGVGDSWEWNPAKGPKPPAPRIHHTLNLMTDLANRFGSSPLLTAYRPSWHQKIERATPLIAEEAWNQEKGRLGGQYKEEWKLLLAETVASVAADTLDVDLDATFDVQVHNEFKGMWELLLQDKPVRSQNWADGENPGTPGFGDIDYGPYYELSVEGALLGFAKAGVPRHKIRFGAPYAVLVSKGKRDADALPADHPLSNQPWGNMSKMPILAFERSLVYIEERGLPLDFAVVDGGTINKDGVYLTDVWGQLKKLSDANHYLRYLLDKHGFTKTPIWWAERYLNERPLTGATTLTPYQDSMARRGAVLLGGLCEIAWSGAARIFQWGFRGEDGHPYHDPLYKENAAFFTADGTPTLLYEIALMFKEAFPLGCNLHPLIFEGEGVGGLGGDDLIMLYNKTDAPRKVAVGEKVINLLGDSGMVVGLNSLATAS